MLRHLDWLLETTQHVNLTAVTDPTEAVRLHLLDSLAAVPEVEAAPAGLMIDIGTGGGIPGLELAVASRRPTLLVDSVKKKAAQLTQFLLHETLASWISVSAERAEELTAETGKAYVVTARGVAELPVLVELASPLLALDGVLIALKAQPTEDEIRRGRTAAALCGMRELSERRLTLPGGTEQRTIVCYRKTGEPAVSLPRRTGTAQKRPLA